MRSRATSFFRWTVLWLALLGGPGRAQPAPPSEYEIKAAFIFNFARFIEWPAKSFSSPTSPLVIGVLGQNPFHNDLQKTIGAKTVDDHRLVILELNSPSSATNCHIV